MWLLALLLPLLWTGTLQEKEGQQTKRNEDPGRQMPVQNVPGSPGQAQKTQRRQQQAQKNQEYRLQVKEWVTVEEGLCVLVPCSVFYPLYGRDRSLPMHGSWYRKKENFPGNPPTDQLVATSDEAKKEKDKSRFHLLGDPGANNCSLRIRNAQKGDSGRYYFRLESEYSFQSPVLTLFVSALTQKPHIRIPESLQAGHRVTVECSMPGACGVLSSFSWDGAALRRSRGDFITPQIQFTPHPQDHGTNLTCKVTLSKAGVSTERTVQLSVPYSPQRVTITAPSVPGAGVTDLQGSSPYLEVRQGQALRLLCAADSQPPALLTWVLENRVISWSSTLGSRNLGLELPGVRAGDSGRYTCRAENRLGSLHRTVSLSVLYPPQDLRVTVSQANRTALEVLRNGTTLPVLEGQSLRLVCVTHSNPPASLSWDWSTLALSPSLLSDPGVLELPEVQRHHEGEVACTVQNLLGTQSISLRLSVHYPPQMLASFCSWEAEGLHCSCSSQGHPAPSLTWWLGEGLLEGNITNTSFKVTSTSRGSWANSSLSLLRELSAGLRFSCVAQNIHGAQRATVLLLPGKSVRPEVSTLVAAAGAAGVTALLCLGACLLFLRVKTRREVGDKNAGCGKDSVSASEPVCVREALNASLSDGKADHQPPATTKLTLKDELELHYASLTFQKLKPQGPLQGTEANSTEYAEIKILSGGK